MRRLGRCRSRSSLSQPRSEAGFGLVEALVAAFVLVLGIGAAITVFVSSGHAGATAERHQAAVALAQEELERIRSLPYEEVGLATASYPSGGLEGDLPDPAGRVQDLHYVPLNATDPDGRLPVERLVVSDDQRSYSLPAYETRELESRSGVETAHIYRFVTWRDEECPLLNLSDLNLSLASLGHTVSGLISGLTVDLGGSGLLGQAADSRATLASLNPVTAAVTAQINQLLAALDQVIGPVDRLVNQVLAPVVDQLVASLSRLSGLDLSLDLCDMDLSAVAKLRTVQNALDGLQEPLSTLTAQRLEESRNAIGQATDAAVRATDEDQRCAALPPILREVCRALQDGLRGLLNTLSGLIDGVGQLLLGGAGQPGVADLADAVPPDIEAELSDATDGVITDLSQLPGFIDETLAGLNAAGTDENTKRVVVAVVLQHGGPSGPRQPIWMSTVVADPYSGLLRP